MLFQKIVPNQDLGTEKILPSHKPLPFWGSWQFDFDHMDFQNDLVQHGRGQQLAPMQPAAVEEHFPGSPAEQRSAHC